MTSALGGGKGVPQKKTKAYEEGRGQTDSVVHIAER